jgi:uncharacterized protein YlaI
MYVSASVLVGSGAEMSGCKLSELVRPLEEVRLPLICVKAFKGEVQEAPVATSCDAAADHVRPVRLFRCSECEHMFASHKQLLEHVRGNTADPSLKVLYRHKCGFFCHQCKTRLLNHKSLLLHQVTFYLFISGFTVSLRSHPPKQVLGTKMGN